MAALTATPPDGLLPMPFDLTTPPEPHFPPRPAADDGPDGFPGFARVPGRVTGRATLPTRQSLGFAAAPVDYAPPQAPDFTVPSPAGGVVLSAETAEAGPQAPRAAAASGPAPAPGNADPSYIWELAATDVFPAAADPGPPEAPGAVPADDQPGASGNPGDISNPGASGNPGDPGDPGA